MAKTEIPKSELCEAVVYDANTGWGYHNRCSKRATTEATMYKDEWSGTNASRIVPGTERSVRLCSIHKKKADKGNYLDIYDPNGKPHRGPAYQPLRATATEIETVRAALRSAEWKRQTAQGELDFAAKGSGKVIADMLTKEQSTDRGTLLDVLESAIDSQDEIDNPYDDAFRFVVEHVTRINSERRKVEERGREIAKLQAEIAALEK